MPILMVAQDTHNNLNFTDSDKPLDFTMSKIKSTSPSRHPLYHQYFGSQSNASPIREVKEEQGKQKKILNLYIVEIFYDTLLKMLQIPTKRSFDN